MPACKRRFDDNREVRSTATARRLESQFDFSSPMGMLSFYAELLGGGKKTKSGKDAVAIVYVEGPIVLGSS